MPGLWVLKLLISQKKKIVVNYTMNIEIKIYNIVTIVDSISSHFGGLIKLLDNKPSFAWC